MVFNTILHDFLHRSVLPLDCNTCMQQSFLLLTLSCFEWINLDFPLMKTFYLVQTLQTYFLTNGIFDVVIINKKVNQIFC